MLFDIASLEALIDDPVAVGRVVGAKSSVSLFVTWTLWCNTSWSVFPAGFSGMSLASLSFLRTLIVQMSVSILGLLP